MCRFRNFEGGGGGGGGEARPSPGSVPISDFWYGVLPMQTIIIIGSAHSATYSLR